MSQSWDKFYSSEVDINFLVRNISCHQPLIEQILNNKPKKVLEVGVGTGTMAIFLSWLGIEVTAIDNNPKVLAAAKKISTTLKGRVRFIETDAFKMKFVDKSFDVVFHQGLLEHFSDAQIKSIIAEQLRVGKVVIFSVPNNNYPHKDMGDERLMDEKSWLKILKGFKVVKHFSYNPDIKKVLKNRIVLSAKNTMFLAVITN